MTFTFNPTVNTPLRISILADTPNGWIMPWIGLFKRIIEKIHTVTVYTDPSVVNAGDIAFFLGCTRLVTGDILCRHRLNLVVHESDLPKGRGFSPVSWQVSMGNNTIPVCLFGATEEMDAGPVYLRDQIDLDGTELLPEIRAKQGEVTLRLCISFLEQWPDVVPEPQNGTATIFPRRTRTDDRISVTEPLERVFDRLRIADNNRYPAWFEYRNRRYKLRIDPLDYEER